MKLEMKKIDLKLPDKIFGIETGLLSMFIAPIIAVVVFVMTLFGIILPKFSQISETNKEIETIKAQVKLTNDKRVYLSSVDVDQLKNDAYFLNKAVLKERKSYLLVGVMKKIADKYGFQIKSFSVNPGEMKNNNSSTADLKVATDNVAVKLPISIILVGPKERTLDLVKGIENSLPILFIDRFDTKTLGDVSNLDLSISSYYVPEKSDLISGNLTLNDLKPTKGESELLAEISKYEKIGVVEESSSAVLVQNERLNPFSL